MQKNKTTTPTKLTKSKTKKKNRIRKQELIAYQEYQYNQKKIFFKCELNSLLTIYEYE